MYGDTPSRRSLGMRDKQILYRKTNRRCQNPACRKRIEFSEMQVGHKTAWSRGGRTTLKNSVCLCYRCNKLQGTSSWATFLKKQGHTDPEVEKKKMLKKLTLAQLKNLAKKHHIRVKGKVEEGLFASTVRAPTKSRYVSKLKNVVKREELQKILDQPKVRKKRKVKKKRGWFDW